MELPLGRFSLRKLLIILSALIFCMSAVSFAGQQGETAKLITQINPLISSSQPDAEKAKIFFDSSYDAGDVVQGSRKGDWQELTFTSGFHRENVRGYSSLTRFRRFNQDDYAVNLGAYINMKDWYCHFETGFGENVTYIYRLQDIAEYAHRIYKGLFWQLGYNYRDYAAGDTHLVYPGLIYYFGDNYISADYGAAFIEGRGRGDMVTMKGSVAISDKLRWWAGGASGEWLYDINGLSPEEETGYLLFSGFTLIIGKGASARIGYTYGQEKPKFFKRGAIAGLLFEF